ncbi:MAG: AzlD domain-containing protein [Streptococcaceae bacterium]|jgi:branched-subunit amino acid transport protein|nr:AzlD domain-containing protein [Streptococcaceae bacterium]
MASTKILLLTILGSALVTWLSRILPFVLLKKMALPQWLVDFLSFVPIVIMSALWFSACFTQHLGHLPSVNWPNLAASLPTALAAILSKNLFMVVIVGVLSLALIQLVF